MSDSGGAVEWLAHALALALTAPTQEKANQVIALAEELSAGLSEVEVARAKRLAVDYADKYRP